MNNRCSLSDGDSFDEMPGDIPVDLANDIPVGPPLLNTVMEVRGESGSLVQEGMGQIYIGLVHIFSILVVSFLNST